MEPDKKRLFFGMEVKTPWPAHLPAGRILDPNHRHMTLAFLGNIHYPKLEDALNSFPRPPFKVGFAAKFDQCIFLPSKHPHAVAWHIKWLDEGTEMIKFYEILNRWLKQRDLGYETPRNFLPHVTLARSPFNAKKWQNQFTPLPVILQDIHLYESIGNLHYMPIWSYPLLPPFAEIEHTADVAYSVHGESLDQLYQHAALALCFSFVPLVSYLQNRTGFTQLEDIIIELNRLVTIVDQEIGCPFKAVSFHSHLEQRDMIFHWEMIVDV